jgi:DNA-binding NtrC family response regulator
LLEALAGILHNRLDHFQLDACLTAQEAITHLHTRPYNTVISDVNMPGMNGLQLLGTVKQLAKKTPVY